MLEIGCLASISARTSLDGWARPAEERDCRAFLYCPSSTARRALMALPRQRDSGEEPDDLGRDKRALSFFSSAVTLAQSSDIPPSRHFWIRDRTRDKTSLQWERPSLGGLDRHYNLLFGLKLCERVLKITEYLSKTLQMHSLSAAESHYLAEMTCTTLKSMRNDEAFKLFFERVELLRNQVGCTEEPSLPRKRKAPKRFET